jgi:hypothetical protein
MPGYQLFVGGFTAHTTLRERSERAKSLYYAGLGG